MTPSIAARRLAAYTSEEILACEEAGITVTLPKPMTSNSKAAGRFGKQDFVYVAADDVYICPARERLKALAAFCRSCSSMGQNDPV